MRSQSQRERVLRIIRHLMQRTVDRGCSEAEAVLAAQRITDLLDKYDLSREDIGSEEKEKFSFSYSNTEDEVGERLKYPGPAIATLTGTRFFLDRVKGQRHGIFFGRETDVMIAGYLIAICDRAMRSEVSRLNSDMALFRPALRLRRRVAFLDGMALALAQAIRRIHAQRHRTGTGIVVAKEADVDDEMRRRGIRTVRGDRSRPRFNDGAFADGRSAGEAVAFHDAVAEQGAPVGLLSEIRR